MANPTLQIRYSREQLNEIASRIDEHGAAIKHLQDGGHLTDTEALVVRFKKALGRVEQRNTCPPITGMHPPKKA